VGPRTLLGTLLVLVSVVAITTTKKKTDPIQPTPSLQLMEKTSEQPV